MIPSALMTRPYDDASPAPTRVSVTDLPQLTVQQIAGLSAQELARLQKDAEAGLQKAKALVAWLDGALSIRYKERARQARAEAEKDNGTVRFEDNGVTVVADLPKKVEWDQHELAELVERIKADGENPRDYVEVTGRQFRVDAHGGHFGGSLDGVALGLLEAPKTWHVLEFKTHSRKSFADLTAKGVAQSKPQHAAQMQVYMHLTGITRALYVAVCKDTDQLHLERIEADRAFAERLLDKAGRIIFAQNPPERLSEDPAWFECRLCAHQAACHGGGGAAVTCRTCLHATPVEGAWHCARHDRRLDAREQRSACARQPPRSHRPRAAEEAGRGWRRDGANKGLSGMREHRCSVRYRMPGLRLRVSAAACGDCSHCLDTGHSVGSSRPLA